MNAARQISSRTALGALLTLIATAIVLRVAFNHFSPIVTLTGDEYDYYTLTQKLLETGDYDSVTRAPGYVWMLAISAKLFGGIVHGAFVAQCILTATTMLLVYSIATRCCSRGVGVVAAAFFAIDPVQIAYTQYLFNESLFAVLMLAAVWMWTTAVDRRTRAASWRLVLCGLLLGAATLTKSAALPIVAGFVVLSWLPRGWWHIDAVVSGDSNRSFGAASDTSTSSSGTTSPFAAEPTPEDMTKAAMTPIPSPIDTARTPIRLLQSFAMVAAWAVVVLPWSYSLYNRHGTFILVDRSAARTFWHANRMEPITGYDWGIGDRQRIRRAEVRWNVSHPSLEKETAQSTAAMMTRETQFVRDHLGHVIANMPAKIAALWNPTNYLQRRIARQQMMIRANDHTEPLDRESTAATLLGCGSTIVYSVAMLLAILGLCRSHWTPLTAATLINVLATTAACAVFIGLSRYRIPLMPFVYIFAGVAVCNLANCLRPHRWRTPLALALLIALGLSWRPYADHAWMNVDEKPRKRSNSAPPPRLDA